MKAAERKHQGKTAFELIEEAVQLLRSHPANLLAGYYIGSLPFVLGLLYFWTDMSRSAFASQHLAEAALGTALLFLWMKAWQAIFARRLLDALTGSPALRFREYPRVVLSQTALQPTGLFLIPLASIPLLPFAWVYAFYQNLTVFAADEQGSTRALVKKAARQCAVWPRQNHALISMLFGFGLVVFLNWLTVVLLLPLALKTFFGVESTFSRSPLTMVNSTFIAIIAGLSYLSVDPIAKAAYTLRCFYGQSLSSGADLLAELKQFKTALAPAAMAAMLLLASNALAQQPGSTGADPPVPVAAAPPELSPEKLDRAITDTLQERKYAWRSPREKLAKVDPETKGLLGRFIESAGETIKKWAESAGQWLGRVLRKLFGQQRQITPSQGGFEWMGRLHLLIYLLVAAAVVAIVLLIRRLVQYRRSRTSPVAAQPVQPAVDVADENVAPDQLPEDEWTRLAQELLAKGEVRLALRALYLGSLALLAKQNLLTIARFKSNRDYERELRRRGHSWPDLLARFSENVSIIDRTWYGMHPADQEVVSAFASNVEAMKGRV